jgi:transposase
MQPLVLTAEQRKTIDRRRKGTLDRHVYERLTAVLAVASGYTPEEAARLLGTGLAPVNEWLRVFRSAGLDALCHFSAQPPPTPDH